MWTFFVLKVNWAPLMKNTLDRIFLCDEYQHYSIVLEKPHFLFYVTIVLGKVIVTKCSPLFAIVKDVQVCPFLINCLILTIKGPGKDVSTQLRHWQAIQRLLSRRALLIGLGFCFPENEAFTSSCFCLACCSWQTPAPIRGSSGDRKMPRQLLSLLWKGILGPWCTCSGGKSHFTIGASIDQVGIQVRFLDSTA